MRDHYMTFDEVRLKQPLKDVKRAARGNDTLVVFDSILNDIGLFFERDGFEYQESKNLALYPREELEKGIKRYVEIDPTFANDEPILLITPFDKDALFEWTLQTFGDTIDPSYQAYREDRRRFAEDYYEAYES